MKTRPLSGILIIVVAVLGFQKWSRYEDTRDTLELEQRLGRLLVEHQEYLRLNPHLAKEPTISENSEEKNLSPAA